ncbi:LOW QUALITY PROTEIN: tudor and KH domain-containing protein-like isoform X1 [Cricetulus griseus]|uniref:LOW QUALITY PROTEIN: tudor and KH domain-containing protein-like isoform X1 n=1 Tax=Cricetulus griseus TaxID=10029 RepID=UPI000454B194|nr:LOW QUALITY PROTEIN: tudor and KH domain-containing protein-like isoform X1 [Cricetulus griseus]
MEEDKKELPATLVHWRLSVPGHGSPQFLIHFRVKQDRSTKAEGTVRCKAKAAIHQIPRGNSPMFEQFSVPQRSVDRIIGRGGETIRSICKTSGSKITCHKESEGSRALVVHAFNLSTGEAEAGGSLNPVSEKKKKKTESERKLKPISVRREEVMEPGGAGEAALWKNTGTSMGPAVPLEVPLRKSAGDMVAAGPKESSWKKCTDDSLENSGAQNCPEMSMIEVPSPDFSFHTDEYLDIYISAYEHPNHFWIQISGSHSLQLDQLNIEMTQHYENSLPEDLTLHIAAPYSADGCWYRAQILGTLENGNLDLYFVDFGDNGDCPLKDLWVPRSDFLSLPFQAIECSLAQIAPSGEQGEEEALDEFERFTHFPDSKSLVAKISSYVQTRISTWPKIHLYDTSNGKKLDIGLGLAHKGYAVELSEDVEDDGTVPDVLKDMATETDASLASILNETQKSPILPQLIRRNYIVFSCVAEAVPQVLAVYFLLPECRDCRCVSMRLLLTSSPGASGVKLRPGPRLPEQELQHPRSGQRPLHLLT